MFCLGTQGGVQPLCSSLTSLGSALRALKGKRKMFNDVCEELRYVTVGGRQLRRKLSSRRDVGWRLTSEMGNAAWMPWRSVKAECVKLRLQFVSKQRETRSPSFCPRFRVSQRTPSHTRVSVRDPQGQ